MNKCYYRIVWENHPSVKTPLNEQNLNKIDASADEMDNRIISLNSSKFDKSEAQLLVKYIEYDEDTGIFKITHYNGASYTIDTLLEKLAINFDYDYQTQRLIIQLSDGTVKYVDLSALLTQYEFLDSDTVAFTVDNSGKVTAKVKDGSIQEKHLRPNYLADIKVEAAKAEASKNAAATSEANAKASENAAKASQTAAKASEDNAAASATAAAGSASTASSKAAAAANSASAAAASAANAKTSENNAKTSETNAANSKTAAAASATNAANSAATAGTKAAESAESATQSQNYAVGATNSSKYYYEQAKSISESLSGALRPKGTVTFANLPSLSNASEGDMYNISNQFTTNGNFKEGSGHVISAGANVYKTADGKWDVLTGTPVSSVNGQTGNVEVNPESIGAINKSGDTMEGNLVMKNVYLTDGVHSRVVMEMFDDDDGENYGSELLIGASGNTFIGAGEAHTELRNALKNSLSTGESYTPKSERMFVASDNEIYFYSNCNNIANRKGITFDNSGNLRPLVTGQMSLGSSERHWGNAYINTVHGNLDGTATDADTVDGKHASDFLSISNSAASHNAIYRGKNLTNIYTIDEICARISTGTFEDLYIGDYFTISITTSLGGTETVTCLLADFDTFLNCGNTPLTQHHAVIVPKDCFKTTARMNPTNTTEGGYAGSEMHTVTLPMYAEALQEVFGEHLLTYHSYVINVVNAEAPSMAGSNTKGCSSNGTWYFVKLRLLNECNLYGNVIASSSFQDAGINTSQFSLFRFNPASKISGLGDGGGRIVYYLSSVSSATNFCTCYSNGSAWSNAASLAYGVRPYFLIG